MGAGKFGVIKKMQDFRLKQLNSVNLSFESFPPLENELMLKTVIFVDDLIENIKSLQQICFKLNIDFYGFHYRAASLMPLPNIDENLEKLRFSILESRKSGNSCKLFSRRNGVCCASSILCFINFWSVYRRNK